MVHPDDVPILDRMGFVPTEALPSGHCCRVYANEGFLLRVPFQGEEATSGRVAARMLSGGVGPRVLAEDDASGSLVMERLRPGGSLGASASDEEALAVTIGLARRLPIGPCDGLMTLREFLPPICPLGERLHGTSRASRFLHGDLHPFNVLRSGSAWVAIDPKGLWGDSHYEAAAFLRNRTEAFETGEALREACLRRVRRFARELGLDPWRIAAWSVVDLHDAEGEWARVRGAMSQAMDILTAS
ncbi:MAG: hypothetical protein KIS66_09235 [Fimbriimonadaceae bacterium]|nr:hypothetical protein [Fimbriimonadaceae bacterium]